MADVFISYKREDISWAQGIARAFEEEGYTTFFDIANDGIRVGETWDKRLERELSIAKAVVVLWSRRSVDSDNVRDEARRAASRDILCPTFIERCTPPLGLGTLQTADLTSWRGDRADNQWRALVDRGVAERVGAPSRRPSHAPDSPATPSGSESVDVDVERPFQLNWAVPIEIFWNSDRLGSVDSGRKAKLKAPSGNGKLRFGLKILGGGLMLTDGIDARAAERTINIHLKFKTNLHAPKIICIVNGVQTELILRPNQPRP